MRIVLLILGGTVLLSVQSSLSPRLELFGARPDLLLAVVVFFALHTAAGDAVIGAWCLGFAADLMTIERPGLLAISYALAALFVASLREYVYRMSVTTQMALTFAAAAGVRLAWVSYRHIAYETATGWTADFVSDAIWGAAYTAFWALPARWCLMKLGRVLGMRFPRYSHAGLNRYTARGTAA